MILLIFELFLHYDFLWFLTCPRYYIGQQSTTFYYILKLICSHLQLFQISQHWTIYIYYHVILNGSKTDKLVHQFSASLRHAVLNSSKTVPKCWYVPTFICYHAILSNIFQQKNWLRTWKNLTYFSYRPQKTSNSKTFIACLL